MLQETIHYYDELITQFLFKFASERLLDFMSFITIFGAEVVIFLVIFAVFLALLLKKWHEALLLILIPGIGWAIVNILKEIFHRARPVIHNPLLILHSYSFPSGHAFLAMSFYGLLIFIAFKYIQNLILKWFIIVLLSLLILFVGLSRIYIGVHYPTDVLGGFLLGFLWLYGFIYILGKYKNNPSNN